MMMKVHRRDFGSDHFRRIDRPDPHPFPLEIQSTSKSSFGCGNHKHIVGMQQYRIPMLTYRNVSTLVPYAQNSRAHTRAQIKLVAQSIESYGWTKLMRPASTSRRMAVAAIGFVTDAMLKVVWTVDDPRAGFASTSRTRT